MNKIDGIIFKQMIISGSNNLFNSYPEVDSLNVFPVPDGDTGTNMNLTMQSGLKEIANKSDKSISAICKAFSRGLLFGARGNSGVILSQIFRGFSQAIVGKEEIDAVELAEAFTSGKNVAYKAVQTPVEGTVLTVIREASDLLSKEVKPNMSITQAVEIFYNEAKQSLLRTPDLLPILKEVGVVDSGGTGFCKVIEGFLKALKNEIVEKNLPEVLDVDQSNNQSKVERKEYWYSTDITIQLPSQANNSGKRPFNEQRFKSILNYHGNSITCEITNDLVKAHIHTQMPGNILSFAQQYGEFVSIKIESVDDVKITEAPTSKPTEEIKEPIKEALAPRKENAIIVCCVGEGIEEIFKQEGADYIVSGGQTMNPSTEDFIKAIKEVHAKNVFIYPNNSNIIMAANQASQVTKDCNVIVIPSKNIPQGISSLVMFNPEATPDENKQEMTSALESVKDGQVTYSIRDTKIDDIEVKKDEFMGIFNKKIVVSNPSKLETTKELLNKMIDEDSSLITILAGEDVTKEEKDEIEEYVKESFPDCEYEIKDGKQPVYNFILSVE